MKPSHSWHTLSIEQVLEQLHATSSGLSTEEAGRRLEEYGSNELESADGISPWEVLGNQFKNLLIVILLIATAISAFLGHAIESIAIAVIVLFAIVLGFIQEYRAERAIEALKKMAAPFATVLRDGDEVRIPARDLVPGDVIRLGVGDKVPADARMVEVMNLKADESSLTGESVSVEKQSAPLAGGGRRGQEHCRRLGQGCPKIREDGRVHRSHRLAALLRADRHRVRPRAHR